MRRAERHHLKENALAVWLTALQHSLAERSRGLVALLVVLGLGVAAVAGYMLWQERQRQQAGDLLAQAMLVLEAEVGVEEDPEVAEANGSASVTYPTWQAKYVAALPKFQEAADAYPGTAPSRTARYQAATLMAGLGRTEEAAETYQHVIDDTGNGIYGEVARLGLAEMHLSEGRFDEAIAVLEAQTGMANPNVPVDAVLMRLGYAYRAAGQSEDALAVFTRVTEEFPASVYRADAQTQATTLRQTGS